MAQKCIHKGCGKVFNNPEEPCVYHSGAPVFHEGQKGWACCKPRVLTFDEFLTIPPCTTGKHSTVDDTPTPVPKPVAEPEAPRPAAPRVPNPQAAVPKAPASPAPPPEDESDDPSLGIKTGVTCKRRGCEEKYAGKDREGEKCTHHPGTPVFHEGSKGWSCCKKRVLDFDEFMQIGGCETKDRHMFIGKGKKDAVEKLETVRYDFYQTTTSVIASIYLKKIDKENSKVQFTSSSTVRLDLITSDNKQYIDEFPLYGHIDPEKSTFKILGTKLEFTLAKTDGLGWPVLKSTDPHSGEIIQSGRAGRV